MKALSRTPVLYSAAALCLVGCLAGPARADEAAVERGEALSRQLCAVCHLVGETASGGSDAVPTFHAIANTPDMTEGRIRGFIYNPHPQMPSLQLPENQIDDIVAYIRSLAE
ncbi:c-type cytochrome [Algihabitans albus]|uniref:c-type cytochrome n=1 Tax=Algihabitans albus TaxID=2164067 RepID=UPI000E5D4998|nr:cytochrome c [Algihabitans albus]